MRALLVLVLTVLAADRVQPQPELIASPTPQSWLKTYSVSPVREIWNVELAVKDLRGQMRKVVEAFEKNGGSLTSPLGTFPFSETEMTQQLRVRIPHKGAGAAVKKLRSMGDMFEPVVRPQIDPVPLAEVKEKIRRLEAERARRASELAEMPVANAMMGELLAHLKSVEAAREKSEPEVLINLTVRQRPGKGRGS